MVVFTILQLEAAAWYVLAAPFLTEFLDLPGQLVEFKVSSNSLLCTPGVSTPETVGCVSLHNLTEPGLDHFPVMI